ncbi:leucine-rich repeat domain-containing protein [uncultured Capnocytophaga sp.]|uniref:leucine-rich repeat domain-containing protein n=1 Tax=uncultured Capnocytophaga sp. TaxID=159273 RepID=UPI00261AC7A5|nr:leucine-rich repeat domain-containing protein [uncultured Capnocytophaga sp.]
MKKIVIAMAMMGSLILSNCSKEPEKIIERVEVQKGSQILSGAGVPNASLGSVGDYYLDKTTMNLYGAKTSEGWGTPLSLKGTQGQTGQNGQTVQSTSKILSGTGAPTNQGNIGDWYIDTQNKRLYGPKKESGWDNTFISLSGGNNDNQTGNTTIVTSDYRLSNDGKTLLKWFNKNATTIDMTADSILSKVIGIGEGAFENSKATSIILPDGVQWIGERAFLNVPITTITIPNGVTVIEKEAFYNSSLTSITFSDKITRIEQLAFAHTQLKSVKIPSSIKIIGQKAFLNCQELKSVELAEGVQEIKAAAFAKTAFTQITLPSTLVSMGKYDRGLELYRNVRSRDSIGRAGLYYGKEEGIGVFKEGKVTSVTLKEGIQAVDLSATTISSITIPNSVEKLDLSNTPITNVNLPNGVKEVNLSGTRISSITIPNSVEKLDLSNTPTTNVNLPNKVKEVNLSGTRISSISIPNSVEKLYLSGTLITDIDLPNSIRDVNLSNTNISSITIPEGMEDLLRGSFSQCSNLRSITLPNSLKRISNDFLGYGTDNLEVLILKSVTPPTIYGYMPENTISIPTNTIIYVPAESVTLYKNAKGWRNHASNIQAMP